MHRVVAIVAGTVAAAIALGATPAGAATAHRLSLESLSSRPLFVTGGDALIGVRVPRKVRVRDVRVRRDGRDVTAAFKRSPEEPRLLVGLVGRLRPGAGTIVARAPGAGRPAALTVYDSPETEPLLSGARQSPFVCTTEDAGLGPALDGDCSAATRVEYRYRTTSGSFRPLADPTERPDDMAQTTTRDGRSVDYVVRVESGVINRSIYRWAILAPGGRFGDGWNGRLVYSFGGGCGAGHQQGRSGIGTVLDDRELSRGYSVISSSLTVFGTACNDVLSAETVSMVKEHVIESIGRPPAWTIGEGGSGGSVQVQLIAQNYPGLLDGLLPSASFPDGAAPDYPDCRLLNAYFAGPAGSALDDAQRTAITGMLNPAACVALGAGADVVNASEGCDESVVPVSLIFDPATNPGGARCTVWDSMVNVYGRDPTTGYARRTLDNTGVQYGLEALREGRIDLDEFLDLNQGIGGYDENGEIVARRSLADPTALQIAYASGRVNVGGGGVPKVPIVDLRDYVDDEVNVHQYVNTYRFRARLDRFNGTHANQVMFRASGGANVAAMRDAGIDTLADWLDRIAVDDSAGPAAEKVIADRPDDAVDACWTDGGQRTNGVAAIGDPNLCQTTFPPHALPAMRAGRPLDSVALKCPLRPLSLSDYPPMSSAQESRLRSAFPDGVCDWSRPGVGERELSGTWQSFGPDRRIKPRRRTLRLRAAHSAGGRARLTLTARLRPCPLTSWQRVVFEGRRAHRWRRFATGVAGGRGCRARVRARARHVVAIRALAPARRAFAGARSRSIRLRR